LLAGDRRVNDGVSSNRIVGRSSASALWVQRCRIVADIIDLEEEPTTNLLQTARRSGDRKAVGETGSRPTTGGTSYIRGSTASPLPVSARAMREGKRPRTCGPLVVEGRLHAEPSGTTLSFADRVTRRRGIYSARTRDIPGFRLVGEKENATTITDRRSPGLRKRSEHRHDRQRLLREGGREQREATCLYGRGRDQWDS